MFACPIDVEVAVPVKDEWECRLSAELIITPEALLTRKAEIASTRPRKPHTRYVDMPVRGAKDSLNPD